ncbi:hypothetical protein AC058_13390 [Acinetobacter genomosp. 33YU]|uniref:Uncharacterized protein n=1 Tax=Acinetobacter genomosp. 33YU TaxID=1675530 RepID=A0A1V2UV61_9GAMM|nr:hypothetical protein AC058_13390 [Acinetobacter genomosp. 33YU]
MIPVQTFSVFAIFLLFIAPLIGVVLTLGLLVKALFFWRKMAQKPVSFFSKKTLFIMLLALICDLWAGYLFYMSASVEYEIALKEHYKESRSHFVLSQDAQYGELLIPKGSLISRYDAFDNGEPQVPFSLRGLQAVRFPHPVQVAGMWVTAIEPPRMELAWDQQIGPVMRFDPKEENGYGKWVYDTKRPTIACSRGDIVLLEIPLIDYDIAKEFGKPEPDGANARFRPGEWGVQECEKGQGPIKVSPAYTGTAPKKPWFQL